VASECHEQSQGKASPGLSTNKERKEKRLGTGQPSDFPDAQLQLQLNPAPTPSTTPPPSHSTVHNSTVKIQPLIRHHASRRDLRAFEIIHAAGGEKGYLPT
jgi:hypothetical protein